MFFRFGAALVLVILIALLGIAIEKRNLALRRSISLQDYRREQLLEQRARLRLETEQLGAPGRLLDEVEAGRLPLEVAEEAESSSVAR
ncbi:MAG: hypothetical protein DWQ34_19875 [Planctomycetota bacterium]|nr:MAG: hypothetical protein DWQ29_11930 [Planctomycetota bacterium]REJ89510.1 MAG: hypothetical protein DWQ34_19875 [Planctomycetota bacterium]REK28919.1 MAG: hypothetical protein DWQ41_05040 [Planctomycetota bacterium]REK39647.1 MAG: hypothetical protein DWQ45_01905 [Planctomycetota bacterium]